MASPDYYNSINEYWVFEPQDIHTYIEISGAKSGIEFTQETKSDGDIPILCTRRLLCADAAWTFQVLITTTEETGTRWVSYSKELLSALQKHWCLPDICFPDEDLVAAMAFSPVPGDFAWEGARLTPGFPKYMNLAVSHNLNTRSTFAVLYGGKLYEKFDNIVTGLLAMKDSAHQPQLLPFLFVKYNLSLIRDINSRTWSDYTAIQDRLECSEYFAPSRSFSEVPDITGIPRRLTSLTIALTVSTIALAALAKTIAFVDTMVQKQHKLGPVDRMAEMRDHLCLMLHQCEALKAQQAGEKEGVQAMVQMVYATLQQRDNELNHRYTADMRVITAITLVFLPGTFVATFFSASFWDFAPSNTGSKVSGWVWLCWVVTIALTLVVLGVWRGFTVLKQLTTTLMQFWYSILVLKKVKREDEETGKKSI